VAQAPENYTYDADGNMLSDGRWTNTWDAENRLLPMTSLSSAPSGSQLQLAFTYDYMGRRIQKLVSTNNGTTYVGEYTNKYAYDAWNCLAILNPSLVLSNSFLWGSDLSGSLQGAGGVGGLIKVAYYGTATTNCFVAYDGNGNVSALINAANGATLANYDYGPFGELIRATGPMAKVNPFRFSTKYQDDETDFLYYGYRYYNPSTGRWLSKDPLQEKGGLNLYVACHNDLLGRIDPLGQADVSACVQLLASIYVQSQKLIDELKAYDPVLDGQGGPTWKPGGHYQEIQDLQRGLKNRLAEFVEKCLKGGGGGKPFPGWADQMANIKVPAPVYNFIGPMQQIQFQIPQMPAIEEATAAYTAYATVERNTEIAKAVGETGAAVGGCYVIYRGIRMIPSLFPALWWTIPANAVAP
jgi:RHS repeat-associated protein